MCLCAVNADRKYTECEYTDENLIHMKHVIIHIHLPDSEYPSFGFLSNFFSAPPILVTLCVFLACFFHQKLL